MSFEHILEPPRRLQYTFNKMQSENMDLRILKMGETFMLYLYGAHLPQLRLEFYKIDEGELKKKFSVGFKSRR